MTMTQHLTTICRLSAWELLILADALEQSAREHDSLPGSCPGDLVEWCERARELRTIAQRAADLRVVLA